MFGIRGARPALALVLGLASISTAARAQPTAAHLAELRLNQVQVVGTHNSYHLRPAPAMLKAAIAIRKDAREWDYSRQPLNEQLDHGVRSLELDLHLSASEGWLVMHVPTFDPGTTVKTLRQALQVVRDWSQAHPRHAPVSLLLELKEEGFALSKAFRRPQLVDLLQIDAELREVFGEPGLITPDLVRGSHATLFEAIRSQGWPRLGDVAGRTLAIMHERGPLRSAYLEGHPSLEGRAMFVESDLGAPHAAVLVLNDPGDPAIHRTATEGYLVRTRADSQGQLPPERRAAALAGAAHILSTDYPLGEIEPERAFSLPGGAAARVNPVTGPASLAGQPIAEPIFRLATPGAPSEGANGK